MTHFKVFASVAYVGIPKQLRKKPDMGAKLGIMLGYAQDTKGYRVWIPGENRVIETINVRFDEGSRGIEVKPLNMGPVQNYASIHFPEDDNIFSAVEDGVQILESSREMPVTEKTGPSDSSTPIQPLKPCISIPWYRKAVKRKDGIRTDIYYHIKTVTGD